MGSEVHFCAIVHEPGDVLDVSAPRGSFTLRPGDNPVVLLSAGVGATPVMSMLHALASREITTASLVGLWSTQSRRASIRGRIASLYSSSSLAGEATSCTAGPLQPTNQSIDFDASGHVDTELLKRIGVSPESDFYLCGPSSFLREHGRWAAKLGRARRECAHGSLWCA